MRGKSNWGVRDSYERTVWGNSERKREFWEKASEDILRKGGCEGILSERGCERNIREGKWERILKEGRWKGILSKGIVVKSLSYVPHFFVSRPLCLRDFPGKNTGMDHHFLLQGISSLHGSKPESLALNAGRLLTSELPGKPKWRSVSGISERRRMRKFWEMEGAENSEVETECERKRMRRNSERRKVRGNSEWERLWGNCERRVKGIEERRI